MPYAVLNAKNPDRLYLYRNSVERAFGRLDSVLEVLNGAHLGWCEPA